MSLSLSRSCGELVFGGFAGERPSTSFCKALREGRCGGSVLFRRNFTNIESVFVVTEMLRQTHDLPSVIAIDEEGGRVTRLPSPAMKPPAMALLAQRGDPALAERMAYQQGLELRALGITVNFAPVLDVNTEPRNPIIGDRAFGDEPEVVIRFGRSVLGGFSRAGIAGCGKHFPGHGHTAKDSHTDLPFVALDRETLLSMHIRPFARLVKDVPALMTAHVVYSAFDDVPATLSATLCTDLLRKALGFEGLLISDDLEMHAIRIPIGEAAVRAVGAGVDALLVCKEEDNQVAVHDALVHEAERSSAFRARVSEAHARVLHFRRGLPASLPDRDAFFTHTRSSERLLLESLGAS